MNPASPSNPRPPVPPGPPPSARTGRGCFATGCLLLLVALLLVGGTVAALAVRVPEKLGIWPSAATLLEGTPDRAGAAAILAEMKAAGMPTVGLTLYVLPVRGQSGTLAYAVLDTKAGFAFPTATVSGRNPIPDMFARLTAGQAATDAKVGQVAVEYRDLSGQTLGVLTASRGDINAFASGSMSQEAFADALHGTFNPSAALGALGGSR